MANNQVTLLLLLLLLLLYYSRLLIIRYWRYAWYSHLLTWMSVSINMKLWSNVSPGIETIRVALDERSQTRNRDAPFFRRCTVWKRGRKALVPKLEKDENKKRIRFFFHQSRITTTERKGPLNLVPRQSAHFLSVSSLSLSPHCRANQWINPGVETFFATFVRLSKNLLVNSRNV